MQGSPCQYSNVECWLEYAKTLLLAYRTRYICDNNGTVTSHLVDLANESACELRTSQASTWNAKSILRKENLSAGDIEIGLEPQALVIYHHRNISKRRSETYNQNKRNCARFCRLEDLLPRERCNQIKQQHLACSITQSGQHQCFCRQGWWPSTPQCFHAL